LAFGEHDEDFEEVLAVFGGGGWVTADRAELCGSGEGAQAAGHLLPELDHVMSRSEPLLSAGIRTGNDPKNGHNDHKPALTGSAASGGMTPSMRDAKPADSIDHRKF
jgi:hypothetical protein